MILLLVLQLVIRLAVNALHVLLQTQIKSELFITDIAGDQTDLLDDHRDGPVDDGDELRVVEAVEVGDQHVLVLDDLHADLAPEPALLGVRLVVEVVDQVGVSVAVELTDLALEGGLADDVLDVVEDDVVVVRVTEGPVVVVVRDQVFAVLVPGDCRPTAPAHQQAPFSSLLH